jgi:hypothetical protein
VKEVFTVILFILATYCPKKHFGSHGGSNFTSFPFLFVACELENLFAYEFPFHHWTTLDYGTF